MPGFAEGSATHSAARAISGDGRVVVGLSSRSHLGDLQSRAFKWTHPDSMETLQGPDDGFSEAHGVNRDGSVIVGQSWRPRSGVHHAFRWTQAGGTMRALPELAGSIFIRALGASDDGDIVVGYSTVSKPRPGSRERLFVFRASAVRQAGSPGFHCSLLPVVVFNGLIG